jgi:hypothetical protein
MALPVLPEKPASRDDAWNVEVFDDEHKHSGQHLPMLGR